MVSTWRDPIFDPAKTYVAHRQVVFGETVIEPGHPVPKEFAKSPWHYKRMFDKRVIIEPYDGVEATIGTPNAPVAAKPTEEPKKKKEGAPLPTEDGIHALAKGWFLINFAGDSVKVRGQAAADAELARMYAEAAGSAKPDVLGMLPNETLSANRFDNFWDDETAGAPPMGIARGDDLEEGESD